MDTHQQAIDGHRLVLRITPDQPIFVESYKQSGRYNITPSGYQKELTRSFYIVSDSAGVSVYLDTGNTQRQLFQEDIESCGKELLRWVEKLQEIHRHKLTCELTQDYQSGKLNAQEFPKLTHLYKKLAQTHD